MWKFILANFPFPIWFDDNPYLLARFFSEQLNGATIHALQADKSGEHMDDMEQIRKQQGHVSLATECRQEDTKNLRPCDAQPASTVPTRMLLLSAWEVHGDGFFLNDHDHEFPSGGSRCCWVIISFTPVLAKGLALHTLAKEGERWPATFCKGLVRSMAIPFLSELLLSRSFLAHPVSCPCFHYE